MESMEKSEIFPPLPQLDYDGDDEKERVANSNKPVEKAAVETKTLRNDCDGSDQSSDYFQQKERYRKEGSTATCSSLTK